MKVLTSGDDKMIDTELKGLKKLEKTTGVMPEMTTRLKHAITAFDGNDKKEAIRSYVDNELLVIRQQSTPVQGTGGVFALIKVDSCKP